MRVHWSFYSKGIRAPGECPTQSPKENDFEGWNNLNKIDCEVLLQVNVFTIEKRNIWRLVFACVNYKPFFNSCNDRVPQNIILDTLYFPHYRSLLSFSEFWYLLACRHIELDHLGIGSQEQRWIFVNPLDLGRNQLQERNWDDSCLLEFIAVIQNQRSIRIFNHTYYQISCIRVTRSTTDQIFLPDLHNFAFNTIIKF